MTIAITAVCFFVIAALVSGLSLLDTWVKARAAFWSVFRQQQLLDAGFMPQVEASEVRLRQPLDNNPCRTSRTRNSGFAGTRRSNLGSLQALG